MCWTNDLFMKQPINGAAVYTLICNWSLLKTLFLYGILLKTIKKLCFFCGAV